MLSKAALRGLLGSSKAVASTSARTIVSKAIRGDQSDKCPPWPYKEVGYDHNLHFWTDLPPKRLDENSKLIVVEGNIGSGKSTLAKSLAEALDFHYIPEFSMDDILVNGYGVDRRPFYPLIPKSTAVPDMAMFYADPFNPYNAQMQRHMMIGKFENHLNACAHIMNTGQGVVMERSFHSDFAFVNACYEKGFYSYDFFRYYHALRKYMLPRLHFWPHLVIYLDAPVEDCMARIQRRGVPGEVSGKVIDHQYLDTIRESYKDLMRDYRKHSRMLLYDWTTAADPERVVEDVENLDLDYYEWHDGEMVAEWSHVTDGWEWNHHRHAVTNKTPLLSYFNMLASYEVDELHSHPEEWQQFLACMKVNVFGPRAVGYNPDKGDSIKNMLLANNRHPGMYYGFDYTEIGGVHWYDHYYRDAWWGEHNHLFSALDVDGKEGFNPHYHHH